MKHLLIAFVIAATSILNPANASDKSTSPEALASFQSTYSNATDVSWVNIGELYKVTFTLDGKAATAFYNTTGSLVAVTKNLSSMELPSALKASLKKEMKDGYISDLFMMSSEQGLVYYVTFENADTKLVMKSTNGKKWTVFQKTAKD
ncbi:MAG TPA: hypothetical protein VD794_04955 [Flavisolibacter sp.]|nr:hypothetical protein [Flavisolibacter sp.]